jgi:hypothetical protein
MPRFRVAHVTVQGVDLIIVPMDASFAELSSIGRAEALKELQTQATKAELRGAVVPVWDSGQRRMAFVAPDALHPVLRALTLARVLELLNRELSW